MVEVLTFLTLLHCHKHLLAKETSGQNTILPRQGSWVCSANGADDITGPVLNRNTIAVSLATTCISTPLYIPKQGSCSIFLSNYVHQLLENLNKIITDALKCVLRGRYIHSGIGSVIFMTEPCMSMVFVVGLRSGAGV